MSPSEEDAGTNPKLRIRRFGGMGTSQIAEIELKIENLHTAIEALRTAKASRTEIDQVLSELARVRAERLRRMLYQRNLGSERDLHEAAAISAPQENNEEAS